MPDRGYSEAQRVNCRQKAGMRRPGRDGSPGPGLGQAGLAGLLGGYRGPGRGSGWRAGGAWWHIRDHLVYLGLGHAQVLEVTLHACEPDLHGVG